MFRIFCNCGNFISVILVEFVWWALFGIGGLERTMGGGEDLNLFVVDFDDVVVY